MKQTIVFILAFFLLKYCQAQEQLLQLAKQYLLSKNYEKAVATFKQLAEYQPNDTDIQWGYYQSLIGNKQYKEAEPIIKQLSKKNNTPALMYAYATLYTQLGEEKKAKKIFEKIIAQTPTTENEIINTAAQFEADGLYDYAIQIIEKGKAAQKENPYAYADQLAILYDKKGEGDKAIESLLDLYVSQPLQADKIKIALHKLISNPTKMDDIRKKIIKRINKEPENYLYPDLLSWLYIQQGDYENAFIQLKSIDTRLNEDGKRISGFARMTLKEKKYPAALLAYNYIIELGNQKPYYKIARSEKINTLKEQLIHNPTYTPQEINELETEYEKLITDFPEFAKDETIRQYADLEARYAHKINHAIELLTPLTQLASINKSFKGNCKLDLGDYYLMNDNIWESTLLYSQVDKEFKQDMLGEEARYKNAILSYYRGDFGWAQAQLDVLKASTSELIANDALNLSVLMTENNPIADSNSIPLEMFARADFNIFKNKTDYAIAILDSITTLYPQHHLMDDILLRRANVAIHKQTFNEAAKYLQKIITQYPDDILADDAIFQLATINETVFNNLDEAKRLYELLILKYPGSTFTNQARKNFRRLRGDKSDTES